MNKKLLSIALLSLSILFMTSCNNGKKATTSSLPSSKVPTTTNTTTTTTGPKLKYEIVDGEVVINDTELIQSILKVLFTSLYFVLCIFVKFLRPTRSPPSTKIQTPRLTCN